MSEQLENFTDAAETLEKSATLEITSINKTNLFTKEQCKQILDSCIEELWLPLSIPGQENFHSSRRQKLRGDVQGFPFMDIRSVTKKANDEIYDFNLLGIIDQDYPQIFKYSKDDYYNWHSELNVVAPSRKLTFIVNLNDPSEYKGGDIEFLNVDTSTANILEQGTCLIFPSYIVYRITPVLEGSKNIIIGHVHGAVFK